MTGLILAFLCEISGSQARSSIHIEKCEFLQPLQTIQGPASLASLSNVNVGMWKTSAISRLSETSVRSFALRNGNLRICDCQFNGAGSWSVTTDATIVQDQVITGGLSYASDGDVVLERITCTGELWSTNPGFVYCSGSITLRVTDSTFYSIRNTDNHFGHGIFFRSPLAFKCTGTTFRDYLHGFSASILHIQCGAEPGIFATPPVITGCTFKTIRTISSGNQEGGGCGLAVRFTSKFTLTHCAFVDTWSGSGNLDKNDGGALFWHNPSGTTDYVLDHCNFSDNRAGKRGGCIRLEQRCGTISIIGCSFNQSSFKTQDDSGKVGLVMDLAAGFASIELTGSSFLEMTLGQEHLIALPDNQGSITFSDCLFRDFKFRASAFIIDFKMGSAITDMTFLRCAPNNGQELGSFGCIKIVENIGVTRCTFESCSGNAVHVEITDPLSESFSITGCSFVDCQDSLALTAQKFDIRMTNFTRSFGTACKVRQTSEIMFSDCRFVAKADVSALTSIDVASSSVCNVTIQATCFDADTSIVPRPDIRIHDVPQGSLISFDHLCCFALAKQDALDVTGAETAFEDDNIFNCVQCLQPTLPFSLSSPMTMSQGFSQSNYFTESSQFMATNAFSMSLTLTGSPSTSNDPETSSPTETASDLETPSITSSQSAQIQTEASTLDERTGNPTSHGSSDDEQSSSPSRIESMSLDPLQSSSDHEKTTAAFPPQTPETSSDHIETSTDSKHESETASLDTNAGGKGGMTGGQIAGIIVGVIVVIAVIIVIVVVFIVRRKKNNEDSLSLSNNDELRNDTALETIAELDRTSNTSDGDSGLWIPGENKGIKEGQVGIVDEGSREFGQHDFEELGYQ